VFLSPSGEVINRAIRPFVGGRASGSRGHYDDSDARVGRYYFINDDEYVSGTESESSDGEVGEEEEVEDEEEIGDIEEEEDDSTVDGSVEYVPEEDDLLSEDESVEDPDDDVVVLNADEYAALESAHYYSAAKYLALSRRQRGLDQEDEDDVPLVAYHPITNRPPRRKKTRRDNGMRVELSDGSVYTLHTEAHCFRAIEIAKNHGQWGIAADIYICGRNNGTIQTELDEELTLPDEVVVEHWEDSSDEEDEEEELDAIVERLSTPIKTKRRRANGSRF